MNKKKSSEDLVQQVLKVLDYIAVKEGLKPPGIYGVILVEDIPRGKSVVKLNGETAISDNVLIVKRVDDLTRLVVRIAYGYFTLTLLPIAGPQAASLARRLVKEKTWEIMVILSQYVSRKGD